MEEIKTQAAHSEQQVSQQAQRKEELQCELTKLRETLTEQKQKIAGLVGQLFMVQPCPRCHETKMRLLEVSPNARSIKYECDHCQKKMHAPAGTPDASQTMALWQEVSRLTYLARGTSADLLQYATLAEESEIYCGEEFQDPIFMTPAAPLPYEQTSRTPIPEAVRSEVWRRDGGRCVQCECRENLQYDHIIPVSRGGATSVANVQLLCEQCNLKKAARI